MPKIMRRQWPQTLFVTSQFVGNYTVARHRMIYSAFGELMKREKHALTIQASTPDRV
jgi:stress-induced morphogen